MKQKRLEFTVGIFVLAGLLCLAYLTIELGKFQFLGSDFYQLKARFSNVAGLKVGNDVQIAGVKVGQVKLISLEKDLEAAIVVLEIKQGIELSDDSLAAIKTSGLIGDKYIAISPGGSGLILEPGETIIDTQAPVDFEELVSKYVFGNVKNK